MHKADLDLPGLPAAACHKHIMPQLATQPLLSIGQLCDAGCDVAFNASTVTISHNNTIVLQGHRTPTTKLWELDVTQPLTLHANATLGSTTAAELVAFSHAMLFSLALSTLEEALWHGHVPEFAGLTLQSLWKHPPSPKQPSRVTWIKPARTSIPPSTPQPALHHPQWMTCHPLLMPSPCH